MRLIGLVVLVVAIGLVALFADEEFHVRATFRAMDQAGYGERVVKRARHSHCPLGDASFAFLSKAEGWNTRQPVTYARGISRRLRSTMVRSMLTRILIGTNLASRVLHDGIDRRRSYGSQDCPISRGDID